VKFKTTLTTPQPSIERPSTSNNLEELAAATNRPRRLTSSDYTTDVSLYNSKSDSWALNLNDETTQTVSVNGGSSFLNGACTDAERQGQRQHSSTQDDETTDLLPTSKQQTSSNYLQHSPLKPTASNLVTAAENPWKKLSNVRYKLDGHDVNEHNQTNYHHVHAQHITFV
jgi:lipopolysaccharide export LptBFGC system permease protein LptF